MPNIVRAHAFPQSIFPAEDSSLAFLGIFCWVPRKVPRLSLREHLSCHAGLVNCAVMCDHVIRSLTLACDHLPLPWSSSAWSLKQIQKRKGDSEDQLFQECTLKPDGKGGHGRMYWMDYLAVYHYEIVTCLVCKYKFASKSSLCSARTQSKIYCLNWILPSYHISVLSLKIQSI